MNRIKLFRIVKNIKWYELSKRTGLSNQRLWELQNGWAEPTREEKEALGRVLCCSPLLFKPDKMEIDDERIMKL